MFGNFELNMVNYVKFGNFELNIVNYEKFGNFKLNNVNYLILYSLSLIFLMRLPLKYGWMKWAWTYMDTPAPRITALLGSLLGFCAGGNLFTISAKKTVAYSFAEKNE